MPSAIALSRWRTAAVAVGGTGAAVGLGLGGWVGWSGSRAARGVEGAAENSEAGGGGVRRRVNTDASASTTPSTSVAESATVSGAFGPGCPRNPNDAGTPQLSLVSLTHS
jgi:hypothetical protein